MFFFSIDNWVVISVQCLLRLYRWISPVWHLGIVPHRSANHDTLANLSVLSPRVRWLISFFKCSIIKSEWCIYSFTVLVIFKEHRWPQVLHSARVLDWILPSLSCPPPSDAPCPPWCSLILNPHTHTHREAFRRNTPAHWLVPKGIHVSQILTWVTSQFVCCEFSLNEDVSHSTLKTEPRFCVVEVLFSS